MRIGIAVLFATVAMLAGVITSMVGHAQDARQTRADYISLCATTPQGLASMASGRDRGGPVGGAFVHRDQVCMIWTN